MHAKGARAKFTRVDTHYRPLLLSCGLRMSLLCPRRHLDPHVWARGSRGIVGFGAETVVPVRLRRLLSHDDRRRLDDDLWRRVVATRPHRDSRPERAAPPGAEPSPFAVQLGSGIPNRCSRLLLNIH
jgi:hypothetical protein